MKQYGMNAFVLALSVVLLQGSFIECLPLSEASETAIEEEDIMRDLRHRRGKKGGKGRSYGKGKGRKSGKREAHKERPRNWNEEWEAIAAPDDTGVRFSKVTFEGPPPTNIDGVLPLTAADYPPNRKLTSLLRESMCISVVVPRDCVECRRVPTKELIQAIGGLPTHVSSNPASPYWDEFREVLRRQEQRIRGVDPGTVLPIPDIWKASELTLEQVAENVHDELPGTHHHDMIRLFIAEGFTVNTDMVPSKSTTEFLRREVMLSAMTTWAIQMVGPHNFACKYHVGRARPEEVAWLITKGKLKVADGVPSDIVSDVKNLNLESQFNFTAYEEGSPAHPAWPAMHSAGSASALWVPLVLNLNERQVCQTKLVDWAVSYARTVAGVHYISDNIAGLNLGQEIIARELPGYLQKAYGADPVLVKRRIQKLRFDWDDFRDSDCYKDNIGVVAPAP